ncbi:MAG: iron-containing redox enzyme family protein [Methanomassiliicoccales archaeon]
MSSHLRKTIASGDVEHNAWSKRYLDLRNGKSIQAGRIAEVYDAPDGLGMWIIKRLVERIYGNPPHPFIVRLQHPDTATIYGYVLEHHHFLMQWVRSCASIISKTDHEDVQLYEIDNIVSEFRGIPPDVPSHHELLLRMGESIGLSREDIYSTPPLPATAQCLKWWARIATECEWIEAMAAMHTLELTANPEIKKMGSKLTYFDPAILEDDKYPQAVRSFLNEGYKADQGHSMEALELIEKYCSGMDQMRNIQSVVFKTVKLLDEYLMSRLERAKQYGSK